MMKVLMIHLDLGIGGAERWVVTVASVLKQKLREKFDVSILTSHHDSDHCFEETKADGKLC